MLREHGLAVVSLCRGGFFPAETAEGRAEGGRREPPLRGRGRRARRPPDRARLRLRARPSAGAVARADHRGHRGRAAPRRRRGREARHRAAAPDVRRRPLGGEHHGPGPRDLRRAQVPLARNRGRRLPHVVGRPAGGRGQGLRARGHALRLPRLRLAHAHRRPARRPRASWARAASRSARSAAGSRRPASRGFVEVEIFSRRLWATDQARYLEDIKAAYLAHV